MYTSPSIVSVSPAHFSRQIGFTDQVYLPRLADLSLQQKKPSITATFQLQSYNTAGNPRRPPFPRSSPVPSTVYSLASRREPSYGLDTGDSTILDRYKAQCLEVRFPAWRIHYVALKPSQTPTTATTSDNIDARNST